MSESSNEILWRHFEIHRNSMAATGKSQARFMTGLLSFLALLWGWHFMKPEGLTIQIFGVSLKPEGLWTIAPVVLSVLVLALIGSINIMAPIWERMRKCNDMLGENFLWTDLDTNKTLVDFFTYLRIWPEGPVEPTTPPQPKYRISVFSYPAVIAFATVTTALADYPGASRGYRAYVYGFVAIQALFSIRIWYRAVCRFFRIRVEQTEV